MTVKVVQCISSRKSEEEEEGKDEDEGGEGKEDRGQAENGKVTRSKVCEERKRERERERKEKNPCKCESHGKIECFYCLLFNLESCY